MTPSHLEAEHYRRHSALKRGQRARSNRIGGSDTRSPPAVRLRPLLFRRTTHRSVRRADRSRNFKTLTRVPARSGRDQSARMPSIASMRFTCSVSSFTSAELNTLAPLRLSAGVASEAPTLNSFRWIRSVAALIDSSGQRLRAKVPTLHSTHLLSRRNLNARICFGHTRPPDKPCLLLCRPVWLRCS